MLLRLQHEKKELMVKYQQETERIDNLIANLIALEKQKNLVAIGRKLQLKLTKIIPKLTDIKLSAVNDESSSWRYIISFTFFKNKYQMRFVSYNINKNTELSGILVIEEDNRFLYLFNYVRGEIVTPFDLVYQKELAVLTLLMKHYLNIDKFIFAEVHRYNLYPIRETTESVYLILSKWRESDLSIIQEKNLIIKICALALQFEESK